MITAIMTTRFPRNAKRQNGTLMALKMMSCRKEAVLLLGIGTHRGRPQMELFPLSSIAVSQNAKKAKLSYTDSNNLGPLEKRPELA